MNFPIQFPRLDASRVPPESSSPAAAPPPHTVSPSGSDGGRGSLMTRSPSIKILQRPPESEQEQRQRQQNHYEAVADYKERLMYERVMRGRSPMQVVTTTSSTTPSSSGTIAPPTTELAPSSRTLLSPQGYLIPVVSVPAESQRREEEYDDDVDEHEEDADEGIFDLDL